MVIILEDSDVVTLQVIVRLATHLNASLDMITCCLQCIAQSTPYRYLTIDLESSVV